VAGHKDVTSFEEFSKILWDDSYWTGREEARDALKASVEAATVRLGSAEEKTAKAKKILSGIAGGLGLVKSVLGF